MTPFGNHMQQLSSLLTVKAQSVWYEVLSIKYHEQTSLSLIWSFSGYRELTVGQYTQAGTVHVPPSSILSWILGANLIYIAILKSCNSTSTGIQYYHLLQFLLTFLTQVHRKKFTVHHTCESKIKCLAKMNKAPGNCKQDKCQKAFKLTFFV